MTKKKISKKVLSLPTIPKGLLTIEQVLDAAPAILAQNNNQLDCYTLYETICEVYHVKFSDPNKKDYGYMLARIHTIICYTPRHYEWVPEIRGWKYGTFQNIAKTVSLEDNASKEKTGTE
jgi:hypothetical protein